MLGATYIYRDVLFFFLFMFFSIQSVWPICLTQIGRTKEKQKMKKETNKENKASPAPISEISTALSLSVARPHVGTHGREPQRDQWIRRGGVYVPRVARGVVSAGAPRGCIYNRPDGSLSWSWALIMIAEGEGEGRRGWWWGNHHHQTTSSVESSIHPSTTYMEP